MKSYEEMARYVLEVRDEHERKQQKRKMLFRRYAPVAASLCVFLLIGLGVRKNIPEPDSFKTEVTVSTTEPATTVTVSYTQTTSVSTTVVRTTSAQTSHASSTSVTTSSAVTTAENSVHVTAASTITVLTHQSTHTHTTATAEKTHTSATRTTSQDIHPHSTASTQQNSSPATMPLTVPQTEPTSETTTSQPAAGTNPSHYQSIEEMYNTAYVEELDANYFYSCITVKEFEIDSLISTAEMSGYDSDADKVVICVAEAYRLNSTDEKKAIAIKFSGNDNYYLYYHK